MGLKHLHLILRAETETSPNMGDEVKVCTKVKKLVHDIGMEVLFEPKAIYMDDPNNLGLTWLVGLTTSHSSFHAWQTPDKASMELENTHLIQSDIYTCGCLGKTEIKSFMKFLSEYKPKLIKIWVIDRERHDFVKQHEITYDYRVDGDFDSFMISLGDF